MSTATEDQSIAYKYLEDADRAIEAGKTAAGSTLLYKSIAHAMTCLAKQRGLPHETNEDLFAFASELDAEKQTEYLHFVSYSSARSLYDNIEMEFVDQEDLLLSRPDLGDFLDLLITYWRQDE